MRKNWKRLYEKEVKWVDVGTGVDVRGHGKSRPGRSRKSKKKRAHYARLEKLKRMAEQVARK